MLVSLITPHLRHHDLLSRRIHEQGRFFQARGHGVMIYTGLEQADQATGSQQADPEQPGQISAPHAADSGLAIQVVAGMQPDNLLRDQHFAASDLFVFHAAEPYDLLETLAKLERGAALLYFHQGEPATVSQASQLAALAHFADLVVAEGATAAATLVNTYGYTALPVHVLPVDEQTPPTDYAIYWAEAVAAATAWLPNRPYPFGALPPLSELHPPASQRADATPWPTATDDLADQLLMADVQQLLERAPTMQQDYFVRSRAPLIGPLLAWLRRNLTSHLREPYIDPTFQRQERFNRQTAKTVMALVKRQMAVRSALETRIAALEAELHALTASRPSSTGALDGEDER